MKKKSVVTMLLIMIMLLCGCSESIDTGMSDHQVGIDGITVVDNFECRIKEVNWYSAEDFDFDFIEPEDGFEYLVIVLAEKNTTENTENAPSISLLSADGKECLNISALSLYKNQYKMNFGATLPNSTSEAYVVFKVPAGSQSFMLQILSNGFSSNSDYIVFERANIQ